MPADLDAMVDAYWRYHQLLHGTRQERLARDAYFWAWDAVETAVMESPSEAIEMIDAMLRHPDADPVYVGAGPIENLLSVRPPPQVLEEIGLRCRQDPLWREAVSGAYIDDPVPASVTPDNHALPGNRAGFQASRRRRSPRQGAPHLHVRTERTNKRHAAIEDVYGLAATAITGAVSARQIVRGGR